MVIDTTLIQQGSATAWFLVPSAILLGALHGLEPGHSKTMMAAFIVAVRGTVKQAVLLGVAATLSHTAVVWGVALLGMYFFGGVDAAATEPYFQLASAIIITGIAVWMVWRTYRHNALSRHGHHHHDHDHDHSHSHDHNHDHIEASHEGINNDAAYQDAHARAHAHDIKRRFDGRDVTTAQIALFGLTGGLIPCPAAITVLLLCLQLKEMALGATLVFSFSIGLALTLVSVGVVAAMGVQRLQEKNSGFSKLARKAPYLSGGIMLCVGAYMALHGLLGIMK
jgi:nickel/cobalt transporter (NicO) family protein